jgi:HPr kinase/phosphorylase
VTVADTPSVHASAVLAGARAVLIRGAAGTGKSHLALALIEAAQTRLLRFARLVGDDRVHLEPCRGRLIVRPAAALAGLIELRGLGVQRLDYEPRAVVGLVVDLAAEDAERLPMVGEIAVSGISLPRLAIAPGMKSLQLVIAALAGPNATLNLGHDTLHGAAAGQN